MPVLSCCICMLPLTTVVSWETQAVQHTEDIDNDAGFEDYLEEDFRGNIVPMQQVRTANRERPGLGSRRLHRADLYPFTQACKANAVETVGMLPNLTATSCGHLYHSECLRLWFNQLENEGRNRICAYCRKSVNRRKDVVTIYAVSGFEPEELTPDTKGKCSERSVASVNSEESQTSSTADAKDSYLDCKFFLAVLMGITAVLAFILQTNEFSGRVEEEYLEEEEFLPFGHSWTVTVLVVSILSIIVDLSSRMCNFH